MTEPRRFYLDRNTDVTGASGTGRVADGVLWPDGTVTVRWRGEHRSTVNWDNLGSAERVHGHGGATQIVWVDLVGDGHRLSTTGESILVELIEERIAVQMVADLVLQLGGEATIRNWEKIAVGDEPFELSWNDPRSLPEARTFRARRIASAPDGHTDEPKQDERRNVREELTAMAQRAGAAEAKLLHAADVLRRAPQSCQYHGTDFERSGMRRGLPKCESCQQPYRVTKVLAAIEGTE